MRIDTGLIVVVIAVLIFYLRLIIIQRERVRRAIRSPQASSKKKPASKPPAPNFSIVSQNRRDWLIAGIGVVFILIGIFLNRQIIHQALAQAYWWLPVSIGIVAFSWLFR